MEKIEITAAPGNSEIIIREGEALKVYPPRKVYITGSIEAPGVFAINRKNDIPPNKTNVVFDYDSNMITLTVDEENEFCKVITGKLEDFETLKEFFINARKNYSVTELINMLKLKRAYFRNRDEHALLIKQLQDFTARTEIEFTSTNDFKGNTALVKISKCKTNLTYNFFLNIPVYKTLLPSTFEVEIEFEPKDGSIICWLVSPDLAELKIKIRDELFNMQQQFFTDYVIIKK